MKVTFYFLLLVVCGYGCDVAQSGGPGMAQAQSGEGRVIVVGIDRTEGYQAMTRSALRLAEKVVLDARPGDRVIFRWISAASYGPDQTIAVLDLPVPDLPVPKSSMDREGQVARQRAARRAATRIAESKLAMVELLRKACVGATRATDIAGFVEAAAEIFAAAPTSKSRRLVLYTDLLDNRHFDVSPDLRDVLVEAHLVRTLEDPGVAGELREDWRSRFLAWGARQVTFPPVIDVGRVEESDTCELP